MTSKSLFGDSLSYASTSITPSVSYVNHNKHQASHPVAEALERLAKQFDRTATRSHRKNNNASFAFRRVTSRRCQAIDLESYILPSIRRSSTRS